MPKPLSFSCLIYLLLNRRGASRYRRRTIMGRLRFFMAS
jgi:hypothetical protein